MAQIMTELTKDILACTPNGISKVKLAKTIYFVYKFLVLKNQYNKEELQFIRMPLGPVPSGFRELATEKGIRVEITSSAYLSYNQENYYLDNTENKRTPNLAIKQVISQLTQFTTSQLVEESHKEPSCTIGSFFINKTTKFF